MIENTEYMCNEFLGYILRRQQDCAAKKLSPYFLSKKFSRKHCTPFVSLYSMLFLAPK